LGVEIVGVGIAPPEETRAWAEEEGFAFELWTDDARTLGTTYGALDDAEDDTVARVTVVLDAAGDLVMVYDAYIAVGTHPAAVLEDCEELFGGG
jgi:peroxiredoxin